MRGKGNRDGGLFSTFELDLNWACFPNVFNLTNSMNTSLSFPTWSQFTRYARDDIGNQVASVASKSAYDAFRSFMREVPEVSRVYPDNHPGRLAYSTQSGGGKGVSLPLATM